MSLDTFNVHAEEDWLIGKSTTQDKRTLGNRVYTGPNYIRPVIQRTLKGNEVMRYTDAVEAGKATHGDPYCIVRVCLHHRNQYKDYVWRFEDEVTTPIQ